MYMKEEIGILELTPPEEIKSRIEKLQNKMEEKGIEIVLLIQNVDLYYFTGTIQMGFLFISLKKDAIFFAQRNYERALRESPLRCVKIESLRDLPHLLKEYRIEGKKVGMELDLIPVSLFFRIKGLFKSWEIFDISPEIREIRSIKSDFEVRQIRRSGEIVDQVFSGVKGYLREGMSELELDGILTSIGRVRGHQGLLRTRGFNQEMLNIHILSGDSGSMYSFSDTPLAGYGLTPAIAQGSSLKKILKDQPIIIDYGSGYNGYVTDETRVFVIGRLKGYLEKAYQVALDIVEDMESFTWAGELPNHIYERAEERAGKAGFSQNFMGYGEGKVSFVGHGLGLEINEWPIISKGGRGPLQGGMVFAFEPKFIFPGEGAVGVELDYIVREDRVERVTHFPKEMIFL